MQPTSTINKLLEHYRLENDGIEQNKKNGRMDHLQHYANIQKGILEGAKNLTGEALVLGFGGGHDIPIEELAEQFDKVTICEIDLPATENRLKTVRDELKRKIVVINCDLTGIFEPLAECVEELEKGEANSFILKICQFFLTCHPKPPEPLTKKYSYIVSTLVATNLASEMMLSLDTIYQKVFKRPQGQLMIYPMFNVAVTKASLETEHLKYIWQCLAPQGKAYCADTVAVRYGSKEHPMLTYPFFKFLDDSFKKENEKEWAWVKVPQETMVVKAYTLSRKL